MSERTVVVSARLTPEERERLHDLEIRSGLSVSDLIRQAVLSAKPERPAPHPNIKELATLKRELSAVGANLNQVVRAWNSNPAVPNNIVALSNKTVALLRSLVAIRNKIDAELNGVRS